MVFCRRRPLVETGPKLGDIEVGASVYINENGSPVEYLVVNQGIPENSNLYDASCDGTWVLRKDIHSNRVWDSSDNDYQNSDIFAWLNGAFLGTMYSNVQNMIAQVKIPYVNGTGSSGSVASGANGLSCKIFLLSGYEVGWTNIHNSYFPTDGARLSYFVPGNLSIANNKRIANYNGSATDWWLRSPDTLGTNSVWDVGSNGYYGSWYCGYTYGVRPALVLPFDTPVDDNMLIA